MGQTCFIGCVLQGMLHCPPCRGYFLSDKHQRGACAARSKGQLCISCIVDSIYLEAFSSPSPMIVPHNILQALFDKGSHMAGYSMQDSHEFFGELLRLWEANAAENGVADKCPTSKLFEGALVSSLICENEKCGHKSNQTEAFKDISLEIPSGKDVPDELTINDCLAKFTAKESLATVDGAMCEKCKAKTVAKQYQLVTLPPVLVLHLKRFEIGIGKGGSKKGEKESRKIDTPVEAPNTLNLLPFCADEPTRRSVLPSNPYRMSPGVPTLRGELDYHAAHYDLHGVIVHKGKLNEGHYISYCRHHRDYRWFLADDHKVTPLASNEVPRKKGYLLFYSKRMW
uniref:USP domain-containing protein n=1 Tax=Palpitomonas bilix TaxID=652834 RepID=A0A7S3GIP9_9EUKA|mmetsp:Transcript_5422/g.12254  ORF Transcript_5422/g.12254 Transcript_5422/m.12254 type:complete len:341 (+) Transcript_5422:299-1321(+)